MAEQNYSQFFSWREAVLSSELGPTTRLTLLVLACYMNEFGEGAFPSIDTLAEKTGLDRKTVIKHLKISRTGDWIGRKLHGYTNQGWKRFEYFIKWPDKPAKSSGDQGGVPAPPPQPEDQKGGEPRTPPSHGENVVEPESKGGGTESKKAVEESHPITPVITPSITPVGAAEEIQSSPPQKKKKAKPKKEPKPKEPLPAGLHIPSWNRWLEHRKKLHLKPYTTNGIAKKLAALPHDRQIKCVEDSIDLNYQGIFPHKYAIGVNQNGNRTGKKYNVWDDLPGANAAAQTSGADTGSAGGTVVILPDGSIVHPQVHESGDEFGNSNNR